MSGALVSCLAASAIFAGVAVLLGVLGWAGFLRPVLRLGLDLQLDDARWIRRAAAAGSLLLSLGVCGVCSGVVGGSMARLDRCERVCWARGYDAGDSGSARLRPGPETRVCTCSAADGRSEHIPWSALEVLDEPDPTTLVAVAVRDLRVGHVVGEHDLVTVQAPARVLPAGALAVDGAVGREIRSLVLRNEFVTDAGLAPRRERLFDAARPGWVLVAGEVDPTCAAPGTSALGGGVVEVPPGGLEAALRCLAAATEPRTR